MTVNFDLAPTVGAALKKANVYRISVFGDSVGRDHFTLRYLCLCLFLHRHFPLPGPIVRISRPPIILAALYQS